MIFRRQTIYFFVLLMLEIPYAIFIFFMGYIVNTYKNQGLSQALINFSNYIAVFLGIHMTRALFLPLVRFLEPQTIKRIKEFLNSIRDCSCKKQLRSRSRHSLNVL